MVNGSGHMITVIQRRTNELERGGQTLDDFVVILHDGPRSIAEINAEQSVRASDVQVVRRNDIAGKALSSLRSGDLRKANSLFLNLFSSEERYDPDYIIDWCRVLLLSRNFEAVKRLLCYLDSLLVRLSLLCLPHNPNYALFSRFGIEPHFSFKHDVQLLLRHFLLDCDHEDRSDVQDHIARMGGSSLWIDSFYLSELEFDSFQHVFGIGESKQGGEVIVGKRDIAGTGAPGESNAARIEVDNKRLPENQEPDCARMTVPVKAALILCVLYFATAALWQYISYFVIDKHN